MSCPCCHQPVGAPPLEVVIDRHGLSPLEASVLGAVWKGRGMPVQAQRIFDAMYADDPDGGPEQYQMYAALKRALGDLRAHLERSGISIESVAPRRGYRLLLAN